MAISTRCPQSGPSQGSLQAGHTASNPEDKAVSNSDRPGHRSLASGAALSCRPLGHGPRVAVDGDTLRPRRRDLSAVRPEHHPVLDPQGELGTGEGVSLRFSPPSAPQNTIALPESRDVYSDSICSRWLRSMSSFIRSIGRMSSE